MFGHFFGRQCLFLGRTSIVDSQTDHARRVAVAAPPVVAVVGHWSRCPARAGDETLQINTIYNNCIRDPTALLLISMCLILSKYNTWYSRRFLPWHVNNSCFGSVSYICCQQSRYLLGFEHSDFAVCFSFYS